LQALAWTAAIHLAFFSLMQRGGGEEMAETGLVMCTARLPEHQWARLENWRRAQPKIPSTTEAIRILLERALAAERNKEEAA
jgi:hypothetical protein